MAVFIRFALVRAALAMVTLLLVSFIVFSLMEAVPADCAERYLAYKNTQGQNLTREDIDVERARLGLDRPFMVRWVTWVSGAFVGEFGDSCILRTPIAQLMGDKFFLSLGISFGALILAYVLAIPIGIVAAASRSKMLNGSLKFLSYLGLAIPNFLLALMIMLFFVVVYGKGLSGMFSPQYADAPWSWGKFWDFLSRAWLPIFVLGWSATAFALQTVRALMLDEIGKLYVTAARARGLFGGRLLRRYPARHALGPVVNSLGFDLNRVFNELPVVALVLTLTEAGKLLIDALASSNDQQLAGAIIFLLTGTIVTLNFVTDIALALMDPRMRQSVLNGGGATA